MNRWRGILTLILLILCGIGASLTPPSALLMIVGLVGAIWSGWPIWKMMFTIEK